LKTMTKRLYEAMFLVDPALAGSDWDGVIQTIENILQKAEAEIVSLKKWADRKLAYKINRKTKGTYILCYFRADGNRIRDIERDVRLSERIMRVLILSAENQKIKETEEDTTALHEKKLKSEVTQKVEEKQVATAQDAEQTAKTEPAEKTELAEKTEQTKEPEEGEDTVNPE